MRRLKLYEMGLGWLTMPAWNHRADIPSLIKQQQTLQRQDVGNTIKTIQLKVLHMTNRRDKTIYSSNKSHRKQYRVKQKTGVRKTKNLTTKKIHRENYLRNYLLEEKGLDDYDIFCRLLKRKSSYKQWRWHFREAERFLSNSIHQKGC